MVAEALKTSRPALKEANTKDMMSTKYIDVKIECQAQFQRVRGCRSSLFIHFDEHMDRDVTEFFSSIQKA